MVVMDCKLGAEREGGRMRKNKMCMIQCIRCILGCMDLIDLVVIKCGSTARDLIETSP